MTVLEHVDGLIDALMDDKDREHMQHPLKAVRTSRLKYLMGFIIDEIREREAAEDDAKWRAEQAELAEQVGEA